MDIPKTLIANTLDLIYLQLKLRVKDKSVRRIIQISEIVGLDETSGEIKTHEIFKWDPHTDTHTFAGNSVVLDKIKERHGESDEQINYELSKRKLAIEWMVKKQHKRSQRSIKKKHYGVLCRS